MGRKEASEPRPAPASDGDVVPSLWHVSHWADWARRRPGGSDSGHSIAQTPVPVVGFAAEEVVWYQVCNAWAGRKRRAM